MRLVRIMYRSTNAIEVQGVRALIHFNDIVTNARRQNAALEVSGFLWFDRSHFFQILEGEDTRVRTLFDRISADRRHRDVALLSRTDIAVRIFGEWSMAAFFQDDVSHPILAKHGFHGLPRIPETTNDRLLAFARDFVSFDPHDRA